MKRIIEKMIALGLTGTITASLVGLTGCSRSFDISDTELSNYIVEKNVYIVVNENDIATLHKGDVIYHVYGNRGYTFTPVLKFNCGEEITTSQYISYSQICPNEEKYDQVCECAYTLIKQNETSNKQEHNHEQEL